MSVVSVNAMTSSVDNKSLKQKLQEDGYVIVDGLVPQGLLQSLRDACECIVDKARNNEWKHRYLIQVVFSFMKI
jgi:predicted nucleic acid-binding protein